MIGAVITTIVEVGAVAAAEPSTVASPVRKARLFRQTVRA